MFFQVLHNSIYGSLSNKETIKVDTRHARRCAEGDKLRIVIRELTTAQSVALLGENHDGAALGSFIGKRR